MTDDLPEYSDEVYQRGVLWLEQARWLYEDRLSAYTSAGQQAVTLLGFQGLILVLLVQEAPNWAAHGVVVLLTGIAALALLIAAGLAAAAFVPKPVHGVAIEGVTDAFAKYLKAAYRDPDEPAGNAERLLHANPNTKISPISSLDQRAGRRALMVRASAILTAFGLFFVTWAVAIYVLEIRNV